MKHVHLPSAATPTGSRLREALLREAIKKGKVKDTRRAELARELREIALSGDTRTARTDKEIAKELRNLAACCL